RPSTTRRRWSGGASRSNESRSTNGLAALPQLQQLQPVAVKILEHRDIAPRVHKHFGIEPDAARLQRLERLLAVFRLDGVLRRDAAIYTLGLPGCSWPENQREVMTFEADGHKPRSVGVRVIDPLLEAKQVRVEV